MLGLLAVAVAVWLLIVLWVAGHDAWLGIKIDDPYWPLRLRSLLVLAAVFGLPIAIGASLLVGLPLWALAERLGLRTRRAGLLIGALAGLCIGGLGTAYTVLRLVPGQMFMSDDEVIIEHGHLTAIGWANEGWNALELALLGALAGPLAIHVARRRP
ncbi:hypothetical protein M8312_07505 [Sphingomonas sp. KRR8]|uniref:hypothetical protein n=1 Tax=Sphingomonas sp. KRR8 TaxID=2942996 RepID=UPI0020210426|nr:hypothetical protein [Sphingomonas sp. KRR8]URD59673.1 hypothetical protein M8312_07505 [Sphingomonas sp. KRR8]